MAYNKINWVDNAPPYLEAKNLNRMEDGIKVANDIIPQVNTNTINIADNTNKITAISTGENLKGTWTPATDNEYPANPQNGDSWYIDGLTNPYTFTGGDLSGKMANNQDKIVYSGTAWSLIEKLHIPDEVVLRIATVNDFHTVDNTKYPTVIVEEKDRGGVFVYDQNAGDDDGGIVFNKWVRQYDGAINVKWFGAIEDETTDSTQPVIDAIKVAYHNNKNVIINSGVKWSTKSILNKLVGTCTASNTNSIVGLSGLTPGEYVGDFVWNLTDNSYSEVISNDATSITTKGLFLGVSNVFNIGDKYAISGFKVGVNIEDNSRWSEPNNSFTGQTKVFLNSKNAHNLSANEFWAYGQYHPAFIAANIGGDSNMDNRASFITRNYNADGTLRNYSQMGISPLKNTDITTESGKSAEYQISISHDKGTGTGLSGSAQRIIFSSIASNDLITSYSAVNGGPKEGISLIVEQHKNEDMIEYHAMLYTTKHKTKYIDGYNTPNEKIRDTIVNHAVASTASGGFTGVRGLVYAIHVNFIVPDSSWSGITLLNTGAAAATIITAPQIVDAYTIGTEITLVVDEAQQFNINPNAADNIRNNTGSGNDLTKRIYSDVPGSTITIKATKVGIWDIISMQGTWTVA